MLCCLTALPACISRSPETHFYVLNTRNNAHAVTVPGEGKTPLQLRRITLPAYLDRTAIVCREADGVSLNVNDLHVWGEPLQDGVRHALVEYITPLIASRGYYFTDKDENSVPLWINVDIARFEGVRGGEAILDARFTVEDEQHGVIARSSNVFTEPAGDTYAALVQAQSRLVSKLGEQIAAYLTGK